MPDALRGVTLPGVTIGKIEKVALSQPLRLGDLRGNRFKVTFDQFGVLGFGFWAWGLGLGAWGLRWATCERFDFRCYLTGLLE